MIGEKKSHLHRRLTGLEETCDVLKVGFTKILTSNLQLRVQSSKEGLWSHQVQQGTVFLQCMYQVL